MAKERNTILVALGMGLLAGMLAALGIVVLSSTTAVAADEGAPDLLPGVDLVTEEVELGVFRVLDDGAGHDLVADPPAGITIAPDGSVWLLRAWSERALIAVDALIELGGDGTYPFEPSGMDPISDVDVAVDVDGVAWLGIAPEQREDVGAPQFTLASYDGTAWAAPTWSDGSGDVGAIETTSDGAVWVARNVESGAGPSVARFIDGEWTELPTLKDPSLEGHFRAQQASFVATPDGTAWLANGAMTHNDGLPGPKGLLFFDGERWDVVDLPIDGEGLRTGPLAIGPDGTLWVYGREIAGSQAINHLARLDADGWTVFSGRTVDAGGTHTVDEADGVPLLATQFYYEARLAVDGDGRLWIAVNGDGGIGDGDNWLYPPSLDPAPGPVGLLTFDGTTWHQYLKGLHVNQLDVADDGTVFATALYGCPVDGCNPYEASGNADWDLGGLYVITPEAVAAAD